MHYDGQGGLDCRKRNLIVVLATESDEHQFFINEINF